MSQLPSPVERAIAAANHGDTDAFLATFTADGVVDDWGREFVGREAIRGWSDREFIGVQVALTVTTVSSADRGHLGSRRRRRKRLQRAKHVHFLGCR
jgi:hypothetical protein